MHRETLLPYINNLQNQLKQVDAQGIDFSVISVTPRSMARHVKLKPIKLENGNWQLSIPANLSETGKRKRQNFPTKKAAEAEAERIKTQKELHGVAAASIPAQLAEDAAKAMEKLTAAGLETTLTALAEAHIAAEQDRNASISMLKLWEEYEEHIKIAPASKKTKRPYSLRTIQTKRITAGRLAELLGDKLVCNVTKDDIAAVLKKHFKGGNRNTCISHARAMFTYAIAHDYTKTNPFVGVEWKATEGEIRTATPEQVLAALNACADHRANEDLKKRFRLDCREAVQAVAVLAFAGLRPDEELTSLTWQKVNLETGKIRITANSAKKRSGRYVTIEDTLREWLELVPEDQRQGAIIPNDWKRKWQTIRHLCGFTKEDTDIMRHTYASCYHRGINNSVDALRANLGHSTADVTFDHYLDTNIETETAERFWSIRPGSTAAQLKAVS